MASLRADSGDSLIQPTRAIWARHALVFALVVAMICAVPRLFGDYFSYQLGLYLLLGMATQGVALCWGRAGLLNLGQAAFFGLGAYGSALVLRATDGGAPAWLALWPLAIVVPALIAWCIGILVFRRRSDSGPYFALITLAICMLLELLATRETAITGGFNGLTGIPDFPGTDRYSSLYYVIASVTLAVTVALGWLVRTPLGTLWRALAQNEIRVQSLGFASYRFKALAFAIGAGLAALAGALYAPHEGIVTPQSIGVMLSAQFVVWAAVGGRRSPAGALFGAVAIGFLSSALRDRYPFWEAAVALVFIVVVRWLPDGLSGAIEAAWRRVVAMQVGTHGAYGSADSGVHSTPPDALLAPPLIRHASEEHIALRFDAVRVTRGPVRILQELALTVDRKGIACVIGPNGAGKSSLFNTLTGSLPADSGRILVDGVDVTRLPTWRIAQLGISRKFQIPSIFADLTVGENLCVALWSHRLRVRTLFDMQAWRWRSALYDALIVRFPALAAQHDTRAGNISQGDRQVLEFVMVALTEPRLMLLDEPCAGLSPQETQRMFDAIGWVVRELDATALLIEHDMNAVAALAEHVYVLHQGQLLDEGEFAAIRASTRVRAVYAGGVK
ncbi:branched-chain amino acid ABC transporter ATP-binding protein/permease [Paraburkholderia sp. ZP32-5]|uniref:branched-chain amino acid ABC transporter ATP-binding protein/permease n=1 Tax=Paraburkholderia sp. ZP32-5 TaxID=2883245 RepID=UPI001F3DB503|nr:ATP-binding cassette domain-containing protein [Paraburkholderia sp. ZP32-5]